MTGFYYPLQEDIFICREDETDYENGRTCGDWDEISHMPSDKCEDEVN